jgi:hypothetical protein
VWVAILALPAPAAFAATEYQERGVVQSVDASPDARTITLETRAGERTVNVPASQAEIADDQGAPTSLDALKPGDRVRVRYRAERQAGQEIDWASDVQRTGPVLTPDQTAAQPEVTPAP